VYVHAREFYSKINLYYQGWIHLGHCTLYSNTAKNLYKISSPFLPKVLSKWRGVSVLHLPTSTKTAYFCIMENKNKFSNPVKGENESHLHIYRLDLTTVPGPQLMRSEPMDGGPGDPGRTSQLMLTGSGQLR
jgi:hypothetical protein